MIYLGVDPGKSGAIVSIDGDGAVEWIKGRETMHDIWAWLVNPFHEDRDRVRCVIEQVNAMPGQGVTSMFRFGQSFGQLEAFVVAAGAPYKLVRPAKWQQLMSCRTGGDKNVSKAAAQRLFPRVKVTHAIADALLLAELARTKWEAI